MTGACIPSIWHKTGGEALERIGKVAREHQDALLSALNKEERDELANLLLRIADQQGLVRGVHPGYQRLGSPKRSGNFNSDIERRLAHSLSDDSTA